MAHQKARPAVGHGTEREELMQRAADDLVAMTRLQAVGAMYLREGNLDAVLSDIVETAISLSRADFGNIQLVDRATGALKIAAHRGGFPPWWIDYWNTVVAGRGVCGTALQCGERVIVEDVEQSPIFVGTPALEIQLRAGVRAVQSTPLLSRSGKLLGMLSTHYRTPQRPGPRAQQLLDLLARQTSDMIERWQSEEAVRDSEKRYRSLFEHMLEGFAYCRMLYDEGGHPEDFVYLAVNDAFGRLTGLTDVIGRRVTEIIPRIKESNPELLEIYGRVVRTGHAERFDVDFTPLGKHLSIAVYSPAAGHFVAVFDDITARKQAEAALAESNVRERARAQELQTLLDAVPAAVWVAHDRLGMQITGNRLSYDWIRLPEGTNLSQLLPDGERATTFRVFKDGAVLPPSRMPVRMAAAGADVRDYEFDLLYPDGTVRHVLGNASPLRDDAGHARGSISAFVDITARKQAEEALRRANEALAEADRRKDEFIAVLSHELRNPLAPIRYALPVLGAQRLDETGARAMEVLGRQVDHLVRLVDDLLDVSRITRGKIELRWEPVTVGSIISAAIEAASPDIAAARHSLEVVVPEEPIWVRADRARLAQVITNLLNNAARYTPRGGRIRVGAALENDTATVRVRDNGIGIPPEDLPAVFEMFRQVNRPDASQGGLGIGLALVRQLIEMHEGTIEAQSGGVGQGTEFIVRLPVSDQASVEGSAEAVTNAAAGGPHLKVLVVDDNADLVEMLAMVVEGAGHDVRKAFDGLTALSAATAYRPDVVLLDLGLPVINGVDVARQLRQRPETSHALLVALTGWGQAEDRTRTREAGFDHHLTKPTDPEALADLLTRFAAQKA